MRSVFLWNTYNILKKTIRANRNKRSYVAQMSIGTIVCIVEIVENYSVFSTIKNLYF